LNGVGAGRIKLNVIGICIGINVVNLNEYGINSPVSGWIAVEQT